jgi:hypothetical protein
MGLYTAEGKTLEETIFSILEPYLDLWYHVYQVNYYNNVEITEKLILRKTRVCVTIRANRRIPKSLADTKKLKRKDSVRHQRRDLLLHTWKDKREVRMTSTRYTGIIWRGHQHIWRKDKANPCNTVQQVHEGS